MVNIDEIRDKIQQISDTLDEIQEFRFHENQNGDVGLSPEEAEKKRDEALECAAQCQDWLEELLEGIHESM